VAARQCRRPPRHLPPRVPDRRPPDPGAAVRTTSKLPVEKVVDDLFPLDRPRETPRVSRVDGLRILLGQTCSTVCQAHAAVRIPTKRRPATLGRRAGRREDAERGGPSPATQLMPPASRPGRVDVKSTASGSRSAVGTIHFRP
jgi:hypothetical protein